MKVGSNWFQLVDGPQTIPDFVS